MAVFIARAICDPTGDEGLVGHIPAAHAVDARPDVRGSQALLGHAWVTAADGHRLGPTLHVWVDAEQARSIILKLPLSGSEGGERCGSFCCSF